MRHLNSNLLCAIDCETTGLDPEIHEIVSLAIVPLDFQLNPHPNKTIFDVVVKPLHPETATKEALKVNGFTLDELNLKGLPPTTVIDLFERWFKSLDLPPRKKITPLAHNWPFDKSFLIALFGKNTFEYYFDYHYRDTVAVANYLNDRASFGMNKYPFPKQNLVYIASQLFVPNDRAHTALSDAVCCAKCYKAMMGKLIDSACDFSQAQIEPEDKSLK